MKTTTLPLAVLGGLYLFGAAFPAEAKDDPKDKLKALQQRLQQEKPRNDDKPRILNQGGNNDNKPRKIEQPKVFNPPANNNNNSGNELRQRLEQMQQQNKFQQPKIELPKQPKIEQPKFDVPKLPNVQPGGGNVFKQPGGNQFKPPAGNQDLKDRLDALKPKDGNKPNFPGVQPGGNNNPLIKPGNSNQDLKDRLDALKPKDGNKPVFPGNQPGNNPLIKPGNNQDLKDRLDALKPKDGTRPNLGNNNNNPLIKPGNNQDLKDRLDALKPKDGPNFTGKPVLPGGPQGSGLTNKGPGKNVDLSNHLQNELTKNPKLKEQLEALKNNKGDGPGKDLKDVLGGGRVANPNGKPGILPIDTLPGKQPGPKIDLTKGAVPIKIDRDNILANLKQNQGKGDTPNFLVDLQKHKGPRNDQDLQMMFDKLKDNPQFKRTDKFAGVDLDRVSGQFQNRLAKGNFREANFNRFVDHNHQKNLLIDTQFALYRRGDVARQLNLNVNLINVGGWRARPVGPIFNNYTRMHFSSWYPGPAWCPHYCWTPHWSPWVSWSFWNWCTPIYDPRPFICRPIIYDPCPPIVIYEYPVWQPLPVVTCGTWIDVPPVVIDNGFDLEMLAVRFVDPGHQEQNLGPRYRVWVRNNSPAAIGAPFNVTLVAAMGPQLVGELPQAGATIPNMDPNSVMPIDIRLPLVANRLGRQADGTVVPFSHLHIMVDSHRDLAENNEANNGAIIDRSAIYPVDPAGFSTDVTAASTGAMVSLAGEGFGPEPGQLLVTVNGQTQQAEVHGWYDLGVNFKMPNFNLSQAADAQIIVVRGDSAVSNPVEIDVAPQGWLQDAQLPPAPVPGAAVAPEPGLPPLPPVN